MLYIERRQMLDRPINLVETMILMLGVLVVLWFYIKIRRGDKKW